MNELQNLEEEFQKYLTHTDEAIVRHIVSTTKVPASVRLEIYSNAYSLRLLEALAANYPMLKKRLGCVEFNKLGKAYLAVHPSPYRSIRWFGDGLSEFLKNHVLGQDMPFLGELARLEWVMTLVFDAADASVLPLETMATIPPTAWANMQFEIHPSAYRLNFDWNVMPIWQALMEDEVVPTAAKANSQTAWLFWRTEFRSQFALLEPAEAWAIDAILNHATFGEICAGLCEWVAEEEAGLKAASLLKGWLIAGLVTRVIV